MALDLRIYDAPAFREKYVTADGALERCDLLVMGLRCHGCVGRVERLPETLPGLVEARLDFGRSRLRARWDPSTTSLATIVSKLADMGYEARPARDDPGESIHRQEDRAQLLRMGIAGAAAGNVMMLAFAMYGGVFDGISAEHEALMRWASMLIAVPAILWTGGDFFRGAWSSLRTRSMHMDVPVSLALALGAAWGTFNTIRGTGEIYFDTLTVLVFLLLAGRYVQRRQQRRAAADTELMASVTPQAARRLGPEGAMVVPVEALEVGDRVEVLPGDLVPADGRVRAGETLLDEALLSGEADGVSVKVGNRVYGGSTNLSRRIEVEVTQTGEATRVGRLMTLASAQLAQSAPIVRLADRAAGVFVSTVLALAGLTLWLWWSHSPAAAIENAVALLIVACPCALGLSTPLAISLAAGRAAKRKLLIKGGAVVEALARPGLMLLDKTGTVTEGRPTVARWWGPDWARPLAAAAERDTTHVVGRAIAALADELPRRVTDARSIPGAGVEARVDGRLVQVGSPALRGEGAEEHPHVREAVEAGLTPVVVWVADELVAVAGVGDALREGARDAVDALRAQGWEVQLLSGDHPVVVQRIADQLDLPPDAALGQHTPEAKLAMVRKAREEAPHRTVVMVGDGVNDAAALAAASCGIAVAGGAEASMLAADVYVARPGLGPLVELTAGARRTVRTIRRSLVLSASYNMVAASLAMAGLISPLIAAILMPVSSLSVIALVLRSRTFDGPVP